MEELIYNLADTHLFFNDLEVSIFNLFLFVVKADRITVFVTLLLSSSPPRENNCTVTVPISTYLLHGLLSIWVKRPKNTQF